MRVDWSHAFENRCKANRKAAIDGLIGAMPKSGDWGKSLLEKKLAEWNGDSGEAELQPYCQVVVYWLRKRLKRI
jgi:hypothetical protein